MAFKMRAWSAFTKKTDGKGDEFGKGSDHGKNNNQNQNANDGPTTPQDQSPKGSNTGIGKSK